MEHSVEPTPLQHPDCTFGLNFNVRRVALFLLYLIVFTAGLLENLLVLWVNWRRWRSANGVLFCILNVSLSDMMVIVTLPFFMMEVTLNKVWLWGGFLCVVTNLVFVLNLYSSSFFLALMTLERYLSLTQPAFPTLFPVVGRRRWWICGGVWLLSLVLALLESVHMVHTDLDKPGCNMRPEDNYTEWHATVVFLKLALQFLVPAAVIITCNLLIGRAVHTAPDVEDPRDVWLVRVYSLVFVLCWLPYHLVKVLLIIDLINKSLTGCEVPRLLFMSSIMEVLSLFHCVANPILYNFLSKSFRNNLFSVMVSHISKEGHGVQMEVGTWPNEGGSAKAGKQCNNASTGLSNVNYQGRNDF